MDVQTVMPQAEQRAAEFSECRTWRYTLTRRWSFGFDPSRVVAFIGLNPSTADETLDDPTIRRCINFAHAWGMEAMIMLNLFGYRATRPGVMLAADDPVGEGNDAAIARVTSEVGLVVGAWGANASHEIVRQRAEAVMQALSSPVFCLGKTKDGHPRHPLYVKGETVLEPYTFDVKPKKLRKKKEHADQLEQRDDDSRAGDLQGE